MSYGRICMWTSWNAFKQRVCACVFEWLRVHLFGCVHMFEVNPCPPVSWAEISLIKWQKEDRRSSLSQLPAILPDAQLFWQYSSLELHAITDGLYESLKGALIYIFIACYFIVKSTYNPWFDASETQSVSDLTGSLPFHDLEHNQVSFFR